MKKELTVNTFNSGLVMDIYPIVTTNDVMCNALNATLVTMDGNDNVLLNDIGNGRVESAFLPEGYIPLGTAELGGIIYIVSYNPISGTCLIGSFPSPERNITYDEVLEILKEIKVESFYSDINNKIIKSPFIKLILLDKELNPGDKFLIVMSSRNNSYISAYTLKSKLDHNLLPKYLKFNVVSVSDSGKITNLNNSLVWQPVTSDNYYYLKTDSNNNQGSKDIDEYRNLILSEYNVFNSKVSGKLGILAQLECIDTFDVTWDALKNENDKWEFYLYLNWTYNNDLSRDKINLYGIHYKINELDGNEIIIDNYPKSSLIEDNDILKNTILDDDYITNYYTPPYVGSLEEAIKNKDNLYNVSNLPIRRNDGTDNLFLLTTPIETKQSTGSIKLEIIPTMPYGKLDWLKKEFSINLDKLGTGEISLIEYRYFVDLSKITLNWGLDAYPERNKKIEEVTINFYDINDTTVYNYLNGVSSHIDNDFIIAENDLSTWNNGSYSANPIKCDAKYLINSSNKSSYSGHFTEEIDISNLELDTIYLIEIKINYNSEKYLYYYRILYVNQIFNYKYYESNDFSKLKLEEAINDNKLLGLLAVDIVKNDEVINTEIKDSNGNIIESIPKYLTTEQKEYTNYTIESKYSSLVKFLTEYKCPSCFTVEINNMSIGEHEEETSINLTLKLITNSSISNVSTNIDKITNDTTLQYSYNNNEFTCDFHLKLNIPLQILYNKSEFIPISSILNELNVSVAYLWGFGKHNKHIYLGINNSYIGSNADDLINFKGARDNFSDDVTILLSIDNYPNVCNWIKDKLKYTDAVAIIAQEHYLSESGGSSGLSNSNLWMVNNDGYLKYTVCNKDNLIVNGQNSFLIYAMLDTNGDIILVTFAAGYFDTINSFMGVTVNKPNVNHKWDYYTQYGMPLAFLRNQLSDKVVHIPFNNYYKVVNSTSTSLVYTWNIINYYDDPEWSVLSKTKTTSSIALYTNKNLKINDNLRKINNLSYLTERNDTLDITISNIVMLSTYVLSILLSVGNQTYVQLPDGTLSLQTISPKGIYDSNCKKVDKIKAYKDNTDFDKLRDSYISVICQDGFLRVLKNLTERRIIALFEQEELKIGITGINPIF